MKVQYASAHFLQGTQRVLGPSDGLIATFPLLSWFIYVAFGYWFGCRIQGMKNLQKFYRMTCIPCLVISLLGAGYEALNGLWMMTDDVNFYRMLPQDVLLSLCYCIGCFGLCDWICERLPAQAKTFIVTVSDSLNLIYLIHWILLGILMIALSEVVTTIPAMAALAAVILALSVWLSIRFKTFIRSHREQFQKPILRSL